MLNAYCYDAMIITCKILCSTFYGFEWALNAYFEKMQGKNRELIRLKMDILAPSNSRSASDCLRLEPQTARKRFKISKYDLLFKRSFVLVLNS